MHPQPQLHPQPPAPLRQRHSDADLIAALRQAAAFDGEPLTSKGYLRWAETVDAAPSTRTFELRFGGWSQALAAAGVAGLDRAKRSDYVGADQALAAVAAFLASDPERPSARGYDAWRAERRRAAGVEPHERDDALPCSAIICARLGGWSTAVWLAAGPAYETAEDAPSA